MNLVNIPCVERLRRYHTQVTDNLREFTSINEPTAITISHDGVNSRFELNQLPEFDGARHQLIVEAVRKIAEFLDQEKEVVESKIKTL